jgi:hypothetical protein
MLFSGLEGQRLKGVSTDAKHSLLTFLPPKLLAIMTQGSTLPHFKDFTTAKLGKPSIVCEVSIGTTCNKTLVIEECADTFTVNIFSEVATK